MKALFIGGTGTISMGIVRKLAEDPLWEVWVLNRGNRATSLPEGIRQITADISDEEDVKRKIEGMHFDTVCDFICFTKDQAERDFRIFNGRCGQFIFISSASAYNKPAASYIITEGTTLANPHWEYSRNKIACEEFFFAKYREERFPLTVVRPSHTYDERKIPVGIHGHKGFYQVIRRMQQGKPVIIHGDGSSLWALTFNSDFAVGFIGLMANRHAIGEAFQITGDEILTWNQIYQTIADALGVELHPYYVASHFLDMVGRVWDYDFGGGLLGDKAVSVVFDNSKLKAQVPEMTTRVPFHRGVRIVLKDHPEECVEDPEFDRFCDCVIEAQEKALAGLTSSK